MHAVVNKAAFASTTKKRGSFCIELTGQHFHLSQVLENSHGQHFWSSGSLLSRRLPNSNRMSIICPRAVKQLPWRLFKICSIFASSCVFNTKWLFINSTHKHFYIINCCSKHERRSKFYGCKVPVLLPRNIV